MDRLQKLVHGHFVQVKMSRQSREKTWKQGQDRMEADHQRREQTRLKKMNVMDRLEDRGLIIKRP